MNESIKNFFEGATGMVAGALMLMAIAAPLITGIATAAQKGEWVWMAAFLLFPPAGWVYGLIVIMMGLL